MDMKEVKTQRELHNKARPASVSQVYYVGTTVDPQRRRGEHERDGKRGTMYYTKTENMRQAEDKLLEICDCSGNQQRRSNAQEGPGYVYLIV